MHSADIKAISEAYQSIYAQEEIVELTEETVDLTEELLDESFDELVDELIEEGYEEEEALSLLEDATDAYLEEAKVTFGHDTTARRASGAPVGARRKYGKRKAGEALKAAGEKAKGAIDSAKKKASAAKAGVQIAGSIAKDEARRAGRKAAHSVTSAPGKAKAAVSRKKDETKRGIKGFIKRQAEKVVKRMSEEIEALKATGLFSEEEIAKIAEQVTTVTSVPPFGDSLTPGKPSGAPKPPTLPPVPNSGKKKPKPAPAPKPSPQLGHGTPGFQYGLGTGP